MAVVVVWASDSVIVVASEAVEETYVKVNVVPEIIVVVTPNGIVGIGTAKELVVAVDVAEPLV
jgi:hypothetical protein